MTFIKKIRQDPRLYYTVETLSEILGLSLPSARVLAARKTAAGELIRLKRDFYVLADEFDRLSEADLFKLANLIQTPSYVSFVTALSYYGLTTQMQQGLIESANAIRSKTYAAKKIEFHYHFCAPSRYSHFVKKDGFFIATPEKALIDALYLVSLGRYALDQDALDLKIFDWKTSSRIAKFYPPAFQKFFSEWRSKRR